MRTVCISVLPQISPETMTENVTALNNSYGCRLSLGRTGCWKEGRAHLVLKKRELLQLSELAMCYLYTLIEPYACMFENMTSRVFLTNQQSFSKL